MSLAASQQLFTRALFFMLTTIHRALAVRLLHLEVTDETFVYSPKARVMQEHICGVFPIIL